MCPQYTSYPYSLTFPFVFIITFMMLFFITSRISCLTIYWDIEVKAKNHFIALFLNMLDIEIGCIRIRISLDSKSEPYIAQQNHSRAHLSKCASALQILIHEKKLDVF